MKEIGTLMTSTREGDWIHFPEVGISLRVNRASSGRLRMLVRAPRDMAIHLPSREARRDSSARDGISEHTPGRD